MDRRTKRSRWLLGEALVQLLHEQGLEAISVRAITERADVAYSTFFRNFESKEALLLAHLQHFMQTLDERLAAQPATDDLRQSTWAYIHLLFEHIAAHPALHAVIFDTPSAAPVLDQFKARIYAENLRGIRAMAPQVSPHIPPIELLAQHKVAQLFSIIAWWLAQGQQPDPATVTDYYMQLVWDPLWALLHNDEPAPTRTP